MNLENSVLDNIPKDNPVPNPISEGTLFNFISLTQYSF